MLSKITKLIGLVVIIGVNGLCVWGSDDYEIWDGNGPMPTENVLIEYNSNGGIEKVIIFKDNPYAPELAYEEDESKPSYGRIGLKLNLPEELIRDCEDAKWKINDEALKQELETVVATEQSFLAWCDEQEKVDYPSYCLRRKYACIIKKANEKDYLVPGDFCKRVDLGLTLRDIHEKGVTYCMNGLYDHTPVGKYLKTLETVIEYEFGRDPVENEKNSSNEEDNLLDFWF